MTLSFITGEFFSVVPLSYIFVPVEVKSTLWGTFMCEMKRRRWWQQEGRTSLKDLSLLRVFSRSWSTHSFLFCSSSFLFSRFCNRQQGEPVSRKHRNQGPNSSWFCSLMEVDRTRWTWWCWLNKETLCWAWSFFCSWASTHWSCEIQQSTIYVSGHWRDACLIRGSGQLEGSNLRWTGWLRTIQVSLSHFYSTINRHKHRQQR